MLTAFFITLFLWVYIASSITTDYSMTFNNLPVSVDIKGTKAEGLGLSVIPDNALAHGLSVNATISGNRTVIGGLTMNDLTAYVDFDTTVMDAVGKQTFAVRLRSKSGIVLNSYTLSMPTVQLTMDRYETQRFEIKSVEHPSVTGADDRVIIDEQGISCDPPAISVYGPSTKLAMIDHISLTMSEQENLRQTKTYTDCSGFHLVDADGNDISRSENDGLDILSTSVSVKIPVYYMQTLPVTVDVSGAPAGFDLSMVLSRLRIHSDQAYSLPEYGENNLMMTIRTSDPVSNAYLDSLNSWSIGTIPLSQLSIGAKPLEWNIQLPEGYEDATNLEKVYISVDGTDLVSVQRWITYSSIQLTNGSPNLDYSLPTTGRISVTLIGMAEQVNQISPSDIMASVNLYNAPITEEGTSMQTVSISLPETATNVWVSPLPKVAVKVSYASGPGD